MKFKKDQMTKLIITFLILGLTIIGFWACDQSSTSASTYELSIEAVDKNNAPALQSFIHGVHESDWLLFAGRTNAGKDSIGGLHKIPKSDYARTSFLPGSFNETIFVYNVDSDSLWSLPLGDLFDILKSYIDVKVIQTAFVNTNAQVTQDEEGFLYYLGGYGYTPPDDTNSYITYNQVVRIHVPTMIEVVKGIAAVNEAEDLQKLIRFGQDPSNKLISTGGELFKIKDTLYLAGGQNFGPGQVYLNAVYPFTLEFPPISFDINIQVEKPITDMPIDSLGTHYADSLSIFRRRDAPIVPGLFYNPNNSALEQGVSFYTGVFQYGDPPKAWNNAIYVHPTWKDSSTQKFFTYDSLYNQSNHNVYACADFEAYDSNTGTLHTFLLGGIGTGKVHGADTLSGFTNNAVHITMNVDALKSSYQLIENAFGSGTPLYGAESAMILNEDSGLKFYVSEGDTTEIVDLAKTFPSSKGSVDIGYVYGGIEAFSPNPQTFGRGKSAASNKIWKVTLTKQTN